MKKDFLSKLALVSAMSLGLVACGGSSTSDPENDNNPGNSSTSIISGTAAIGEAIANAQVEAKCHDGSGFTSLVFTNSEGEFTGRVAADSFPCALRIESDVLNATLHSFAAGSGITNITTLTDIAIGIASNTTPDQWFSDEVIDGFESALETATSEFLETLDDASFSIPGNNFDPFTIEFEIGDIADQLLDAVQAALNESELIDDYEELLDLMAGGQLDLFPDAILLPVSGDDEDDLEDDGSDDGDNDGNGGDSVPTDLAWCSDNSTTNASIVGNGSFEFTANSQQCFGLSTVLDGLEKASVPFSVDRVLGGSIFFSEEADLDVSFSSLAKVAKYKDFVTVTYDVQNNSSNNYCGLFYGEISISEDSFGFTDGQDTFSASFVSDLPGDWGFYTEGHANFVDEEFINEELFGDDGDDANCIFAGRTIKRSLLSVGEIESDFSLSEITGFEQDAFTAFDTDPELEDDSDRYHAFSPLRGSLNPISLSWSATQEFSLLFGMSTVARATAEFENTSGFPITVIDSFIANGSGFKIFDENGFSVADFFSYGIYIDDERVEYDAVIPAGTRFKIEGISYNPLDEEPKIISSGNTVRVSLGWNKVEDNEEVEQ